MWKTEASEQLHSNTFLSNCLCHLADDRADQGFVAKRVGGRVALSKRVCEEVAHFITFPRFFYSVQCESRALWKSKDRLLLLPDLLF
ncbi:hypothetical protein CEXT_37051 [Caerostris extrusa]|uniref:Uncharacterized protein n=1 Tax=Caerostris extrusa TaxID=172846 RepID=A0AAV4P700_CAEEX|nr:hypothetical protein CEXT_37051 [Caerostris extrusa]